MNYIAKSREYYENRYDLYTIQLCLQTLQPETDVPIPNQELMPSDTVIAIKENFAELINYFKAGERYRSRQETIDKWIAEDQSKEDYFNKALDPSPVLCKKCYKAMRLIDKDLFDFLDKPLRVLFMFECPTCNCRKAIYDNGEEYKSENKICPKCKSNLNTKSVKTKKIISVVSTCTSCDYKDKYEIDLNVDSSKYEKEELRRLPNIRQNILDINMTIDDTFKEYGRVYEREDFIVPNRNALLILLASMHGETIYLAATDGDRSHDKDFKFAALTEDLLNYMWRNQHWTEDRTFDIILPYKHLTKYDLLRTAVEDNMPVRNAILSFSCYSPTEEGKECGCCKACIRNWSAIYLLIRNLSDIKNSEELETKELEEMLKQKYNTLPYDSIVNNDKLLEKIIRGKWRGEEDSQILKALNFYHFLNK